MMKLIVDENLLSFKVLEQKCVWQMFAASSFGFQ